MIGPVHERGMFNIERFGGHRWHGGMNRATSEEAIKVAKLWFGVDGMRHRVFNPEGQLVFDTDTSLPVSGPVDVLAVLGELPLIHDAVAELIEAGNAWCDLMPGLAGGPEFDRLTAALANVGPQS